MLRNFNPSASSRNPKTTFTEFSQPPDLGRLLSHEGNIANSVKGSAKASAKPNIPMMGIRISPPAEATSIAPTIGPVQEKDTRTNVNAMKKGPVKPPLSTCLSDFVTSQLGSVISNNPKNEAAKITKIKKKKTFGIQCVLSQLAKFAPSVIATTVPIIV